MTTAPSPHHQWISATLSRLLGNHLVEQTPAPGNAVRGSWSDSAHWPRHPRSRLRPHAQPAYPDRKRIVGVPDILIEIALPGTAAYDRREKQDAYARSGVPEYWWVDPGARTVEVLVLAEPGRYRPHGLVERHATIPSLQLPGLQFPVDSIFMPRVLLANLPPE
jgi:Uma2 family endonuclease